MAQICIITPAGMICEANSYLHMSKRGKTRRIKEKVPRGIEDRIANLVKLSGLSANDRFLIFSKP